MLDNIYYMIHSCKLQGFKHLWNWIYIYTINKSLTVYLYKKTVSNKLLDTLKILYKVILNS